MSSTVKILDANKELAVHKVPANKVLVLEAQDSVNYQLVNDQTGFGPQNIITKRQGDDLVIFLEDGDMQEDIIIKDYYDGKVSTKITGLHENGNLYAYVPESGKVAESISVLAEEVSVPQALGGEKLAVPFWVWDPWKVAGTVAGVAAVAGLVAAAGGGSKGGAPAAAASSTDPRSAEAERLVRLAEAAELAAEKKAAELQQKMAEGKVITSADLEELNALNQLVEQYKGAANEYVVNLPANLQQNFPQRIENINTSPAPSVNTADNNSGGNNPPNNNGIGAPFAPPPVDPLEAAAKRLVTLAEQADAAAKKKAKEIQDKIDNGRPVSADDLAELAALNKAVADRKQVAEEYVGKLPNDLQGTFPSRLEKVAPTSVEAQATDKDNDGVEDSVEEDKALKLIELAEAAETEAEKKLQAIKDKAEANGGVISQRDINELKALNDAVLARKAAADAAVKGLPPSSDEKTGLADRVKQVEPTNEPLVNDKDNNGTKDSQDTLDQKKLVEELVKAAENAEKLAEDFRKTALQDGIISQAEVDTLTKLNDQVKARKAAAEKALAELPTADQAPFIPRLKDVSPTAPLTATDKDNDGKIDTAENKLADNLTRETVEAYDRLLEEKKRLDGKAAKGEPISEKEIENFNQLNNTFKATKEAAEKAIAELDDTAFESSKDGFKDKINKLAEQTLAETTKKNDYDNDGVVDTKEVEKVNSLIEAAEEAQDYADRELLKLVTKQTNGEVISQAELDALAALNDVVRAKKAAAEEAFARLPEDNPDITVADRQALQGRIENISEAGQANPEIVPEANDKDNDGVNDAQPKQVATDLLAQAKAAAAKAKALSDKLLEKQVANEPIAESDVALLNAYNAQTETLKAAAQKAIANLPASDADKAEMGTQAKQVKPAFVPAANDSDNDGKIDTAEKDKAERLIAEAKELNTKLTTALNALKEKDIKSGIEVAEAKRLQNLFNAKLDEAKKAYDDVPEALKQDVAGKDALTPTLPNALTENKEQFVSNDTDGDGVKDTEELKIATDLKVKAEGIITEMNKLKQDPTEAKKAVYDELTKQLEEVKKAFALARESIPAKTGDTATNQDIELAQPDPIGTVEPYPSVTTQPDADPIQALIDKGIAAQTQAKALKAKIDNATAPKVISAADLNLLKELNKIITESEEAAKEKIKQLGETEAEQTKKAAYLAQLDPTTTNGTAGEDPLKPVDISGLTVNDTDNDGVIDPTSEPKSPRKLLEEARKAAADAEKKLEEIKAKGVISQDDVNLLEAMNALTKSKKAAALKEINKLGDAEKRELTAQHDAIDTVRVHADNEITDKNNDGVNDSTPATDGIQALINAALAADRAAETQKQAILGKEVFSAADKALLDALNQDLAAKKAAAEKAINALPDGTAKDGFNAQLTPNTNNGDKADKLAQKTLPEDKIVNDTDNDGVKDDVSNVAKLVALAEAAEARAEAKRDEIQQKAKDNGGVISKADTDALAELNKQVEAAKAKADDAVKALPNTDSTKNDLADRVGRVEQAKLKETEITNDQDNDGVKDSVSLDDLVTQAEKAEKAAEALLKAINADAAANNGVVSQTDIDALTELNKEVAAKKAVAQAAINAVKTADPEAVKAFEDRLADVAEAAPAPAVTDKDNDGVADNQALNDFNDLLEAAEAAKDKAQEALNELLRKQQDPNAVISQSEIDALQALNDDIAAKKAAAEKAIERVNKADLPDGVKEGLGSRLEALGPVGYEGQPIPEPNDKNNDGILDSKQTNELDQLIDAAQEAQKKAAAKLAEMKDRGNPISQADVDVLKALNQEVVAAKAKAEEARKALAAADLLTDAQKAEETGAERTIEAIEPVEVPAVQDSNNNLDADTKDVADAEALVKAAEDAAKKAVAKLGEITRRKARDGVVSAADVEVLEELNRIVESTKAAAQQAIDNLPESDKKTELDGREDKVQPVTVPEITDSNNELNADNAALKAAADAVKKAEEAEKAAEAKRDEIAQKQKETGVVSKADQDELDRLNGEVETLKEKAAEEIAKLPTGDDKTQLENRKDEVNQAELPEDFPEVNDTNNDGVEDSKELKNVKALIKAAEDAQQAANRVKTELEEKLAGNGGVLSAQDQARLDAANQELAEKTAAANKAVAALTDEQKAQLTEPAPSVLKDNDPVTLGTAEEPLNVNDSDNDGIKDSDELANANRLVEEAKKAAEEAKALGEKLAAAEKAGEPVSQADVDKLNKLNEVVVAKEAAAQQAVDNLPPSEKKAEFDGILKGDDVKPFTPVPAVTDSDNDGVKDDAALTNAQRLVEEAKKATEEAKVLGNKLKQAADRGEPVSQADVEKLNKLNEVVEAKEAAAQQAVDNLPESEDKTTLNNTLNGELVQPFTPVPTVTDSNNDGVKDDAALTNAQRLVEEAKKASEEAKVLGNKLQQAADRGEPVSQADVDKLNKLNEVVVAKEAAAQQAVDNLPESADKTALDSTLKGDDVKQFDPVPTVTDSNNDGVADTDTTAQPNVEALVEAAKAAQQAIDEKLKEIKQKFDATGGAVSAADKQALDALNADLATKKAAAEQAVNNLSEEERGEHPTTLQGLAPKGLGNIGENFPAQPNDNDNDGVPDGQPNPTKPNVEALVEAAKAAQEAINDKLDEIKQKFDATGAVSEADKQALDALNDDLTAKKAAAQSAVDTLPENEQGKFEGELLPLTTKTLQQAGENVPETPNDRDNDGVPDGQPDPTQPNVEALVKAAEDAQTAIDNKLREIKQKFDATGGAVSEADKQALDALNDDLTAKKAAAEQAVNNLPADAKGDFPTRLQPLTPKTLQQAGEGVPEGPNDFDNDGVPDRAQNEAAQDRANQLLAEAIDAEERAQAKLAEINQKAAENGGVVSKADVEALEALNAEVADRKAAAKAAIEALPDSNPEKTEMLADEADIQAVDVPRINDVNNDGSKDSDAEIAALEAVKAAEAAEDAAEKAKQALENSDVVSQADLDALADLNEQVETLKAQAQQAVKALPEDSSVKADLSDRADGVNPATLPEGTEANDKDNDGVEDSEQLENAQDAVTAAEEAVQAANKALEEAAKDPAVSPEEVQALQQKVDEANQALADAQGKVDGLPDSEDKDALANKLAALQPNSGEDEALNTTIPAVTDSNGNGTPDAEDVKAAQNAVKSAKEKVDAANKALATAKDTGITADERQELADKVKAAEEALKDAEKALANVPEAMRADLAKPLENVKVDEADKAAALTNIPEQGNDSNNNNVPDVEELRAAKEKVEPLEQKINDFNQKANALAAETPETPEAQQEWATKKAALETEKAQLAKDIQAAKDAVGEVPAGTTEGNTTPDSLKTALNDLPALSDLPTDDNGNGIPDNKDFENAKTAYNDAKDKVKAINDRIKDINEALASPTSENAATRAVTATELEELKTKAKDANDALKAAAQKLAQVPTGYTTEGDEPNSRDELNTALAELKVDPLPLTEANSTAGVKPDADLVAEAQKALNDAKAQVDKLNEKLKGVVKAEDRAALEEEKRLADEAVTAAKDKIDALPDSPEKTALQAKVTDDTKPKTDSVTVNDSDNDGITDNAERDKAAAMLKAVKDAKRAYEKELEKLKGTDGTLTNEEIDSLADEKAAFETAKTAALKYFGENTTPASDAYNGGTPDDRATKKAEIDGITLNEPKKLVVNAEAKSNGDVTIDLPTPDSKITKMTVKYFEQSDIRFNNENYAIGIEREVVLTRNSPTDPWTIESTEGVQAKSLSGGYGLFSFDNTGLAGNSELGTASRAWTIEKTEADLATTNVPIAIAKDGVALKEAIHIKDGKLVLPVSEIKGGTPVNIKVESSDQTNKINGDSEVVQPQAYVNTATALDRQVEGDSFKKVGNEIQYRDQGTAARNLVLSYKPKGSDSYVELYLHRARRSDDYQNDNLIDPKVQKSESKNKWYEHSQYHYGQNFSNYIMENGAAKQLPSTGIVRASGDNIDIDATQLDPNSKVYFIGFQGFTRENYIHAEVDVATGQFQNASAPHSIKLVDGGEVAPTAYNKVSEISQKENGNVILTGYNDYLNVDAALNFNIDGGVGRDTVKVTHNTVDLAKFSNVEIIDLSHSGNQTVTNVTAETLAKNTGLKISGTAGDQVDLADGAVKGATVDGYDTYTIGDQTVLIQEGIIVI